MSKYILRLSDKNSKIKLVGQPILIKYLVQGTWRINRVPCTLHPVPNN